ncbi:hypothetical protein E4198_04515 [Streptomyces sp. RKND-216]|uniref:DUF6039 family protein n=1 Tax=Streptomyces sp. RKND-216 TaxID=2562581 RepID=UPI00109E0F81|nr:DUF6039 family protein [Streptomyces sp. RKND-216]THA24097.1 hypothetical protein E4198_04515 [Streptomyces sp. RKND-216]
MTVSPAPVHAHRQTSVSAETLLHSTNAGVVVKRTAQLKQAHRAEGRRIALLQAEFLNTKYAGEVTVFVLEEAFGRRDRLHWMIHLRSLAGFRAVSALLDGDEGPAAETDWQGMFTDGSFEETALIPQGWGMYGTDEVLPDGTRIADATPGLRVPPAQEQTAVAPRDTVHSANAGLIIHRVAQPRYAFRAEARMFARRITESINTRLPGIASSFLYEEAFGPADRTHWLIHMHSENAYYDLIDMHMRMDDEVRDIYLDEIIAPEKGGGTWNRIFVDGSMGDVACAPLPPLS